MRQIWKSARALSLRLAALFLATVGMSGLIAGLGNSPFAASSDGKTDLNAAHVHLVSKPAGWLLSLPGVVKPEIRPAATVQPPAMAADPLSMVAGLVDAGEASGCSVRLSQDGFVPGRFTVIDPATGHRVAAKRLIISFVQGGKIVAQTRPGVEGVFQAAGLTPGVYSLIASGPDGYLAVSILVEPAVKGGVQPAEQALQIDTALVSAESAPLVHSLIRNSSSSRRQPIAGADLNPALAVPMAETISQQCRTPQLIIGLDGHLRGRLHLFDPSTHQSLPASDCTAFLIRQKKLVAQADVNQDGVFDVNADASNLTPGEFSLLIAGSPRSNENLQAGTPASDRSTHFAALGITVIRTPLSERQAVRSKNLYKFASAVRLVAENESAGVVDVWGGLVSAEDIQASAASTAEGVGGSLAEGMAASGSGGGGGGGIGQGGMIGGALVGGAIAGGVLAASRHGDHSLPASPATTR